VDQQENIGSLSPISHAFQATQGCVRKRKKMTETTIRQINVLLVDDVTSVRMGLSTLLKLKGDLKIIGEAKNGLEAVRLAEQLKPDVILMDLAMPELDGFEATSRIKANHPEIGIIVFSIHDDDDAREKACAVGADAFINKEAETQQLIDAIQNVSAQAASRRPKENHNGN
jgi:DNA-binding NarL/FixJ family response regulator